MFKRWIEITEQKSSLMIGPRRAGKTTLLKQRYPALKYVTLDDLDLLDWAKSDPKGFVSSLGSAAIIDEIQRFPLLTVAVKYAIDNENACFFMTGSSTIGLMDAAADTLAGRITIISLPSVCWGEEQGKPTHSILAEKADLPQIREAYRGLKSAVDFQIMFLARLEGATLSKAYGWYVVEGGRLITQPKTLSGRIYNMWSVPGSNQSA